MSETSATATDEQVTIYTAYEIDFMLGLRDTENGRITREQVGLRRAPEAARRVRHRGGHLRVCAPAARSSARTTASGCWARRGRSSPPR